MRKLAWLLAGITFCALIWISVHMSDHPELFLVGVLILIATDQALKAILNQ